MPQNMAKVCGIFVLEKNDFRSRNKKSRPKEIYEILLLYCSTYQLYNKMERRGDYEYYYSSKTTINTTAVLPRAHEPSAE